MKIFVAITLVMGLLALGGCHSGTMRGVGSDVESLGDRMQR